MRDVVSGCQVKEKVGELEQRSLTNGLTPVPAGTPEEARNSRRGITLVLENARNL
jgi:hypothetical protein